ncbi:hypothetical protein E4S40_03630 [Algoriphagus kandeliae]|uniref:Uncharacterized protein n=1 Tax=Algoriphagus kandeliae TaxID=2562278 RepID=A0A4Y9QYX8_9BACT|nr:hypothetical protein [Algoriphagus kandeliae]TFV97744.1 hypothetical protein E4S40_03630 [Algoriphagus kandeliae]
MKYKISIPVFFKVNSNTLKCSIDLKKIKMKKNYFLGKNLLILLTGSLIATSCMTDAESPVIQDDQVEIALEDIGQTGEENLRKGGFMAYQDVFSNQIFALDKNFKVVIDPEKNFPDIKYLPGFGFGKSRGLGKSFSFINQEVIDFSTSKGAPAKYIFMNDLMKLGLNLDEIPENASTIIVNERGHALFMVSGENEASFPDADGIRTFSADVTILGGTKIFKDATGSGTVSGWYNGSTGEGESTVTAEIKLK